MAEEQTQMVVGQPTESMEQASEQRADSVSSDEYNPAQAVQHEVSQTDPSPSSPSPTPSHDGMVMKTPEDRHPSSSTVPDIANIIPSQPATPATDTLADIPNVEGSTELATSISKAGEITDDHTSSLHPNMVLNDISQNPSNLSPSLAAVVPSPPSNVTPADPAPQDSTMTNGHTNPTIQEAEVQPDVTGTSTAAESKPQPSNEATAVSLALPKARLPHDTVGILEDRIKEDPVGDIAAWLDLIKEHRQRGKIDDARSVYDRFLIQLPSAAEQWVAYAQMENEAEEKNRMETIFSQSLMQLPNLQLWSLYLDHVRRHHNTTLDTSGKARETLHQCYELALGQVGLDKEAGRLWQDYIAFIKQGPGVLGGSGWQDQQKMDLLRKTYQKAIAMPNQSTSGLWREYNEFENGLNKTTGRKFLQEHSSRYMEARGAISKLQVLTAGLRRTSIPILPPAPGFDGDSDYMKQVEIWKNWIEWEKSDPLVLKDEDISAYRTRVVFVLKQALMAMRFWPELWFEAADFCFQNDLVAQGDDFLVQGAKANPESFLLAFKRADRLELSTANSGEDAKQRGVTVREPYDKLLDALYGLVTKATAQETRDLALVEVQYASPEQGQVNGVANGNDDESAEAAAKEKAHQKELQISNIKQTLAAKIKELSQAISHVWIALLRAMRRIQGKGRPGDELGGSRQIFNDARKRGRITSDVYVESAMIEYHCYEAEVAQRILERGLKLFPDDEAFALEYIRHLVRTNDHTNARAIFEKTVRLLLDKPESSQRAKPLFKFFHDYESRYGELAHIVKLEQRMKEHFPEDPTLALFSSRFNSKSFDPIAYRPIISTTAQMRPKSKFEPQSPTTQQLTINNALGLTGNSPKRPAPMDDSDTDGERPRKLARGESPLKGAAGRRVNQQKGHRHHDSAQPNSYTGPQMPLPPPPPTLPRDVLFLLGIIPRPEFYKITRFNASKMVNLFRDTEIPPTMDAVRLLQAAKNQPTAMPQLQQRPPISQYAPTPPITQTSYPMPQAASGMAQYQQPQYAGGFPFQR